MPTSALWGARSRPEPVTWGDAPARGRHGAGRMMVNYVRAPAVPDLRSGLWLAGSTRPLVGRQGLGIAGATA
ncbi:hypothetical protein FRAHR75_1520007 [Frankia sp. Hr75.2]|nr:hypothetical protein FRAHR75_1520007 [Frankia sp. Hr75.2]